ncbi:MAG: hypothetical protein ABII82_20800, partial [Verrucomicrobiota bacterium]
PACIFKNDGRQDACATSTERLRAGGLRSRHITYNLDTFDAFEVADVVGHQRQSIDPRRCRDDRGGGTDALPGLPEFAHDADGFRQNGFIHRQNGKQPEEAVGGGVIWHARLKFYRDQARQIQSANLMP